MRRFDAIVVGSGPNGLAAAITLAQSGKSVLIREASPTVGGGLKTEPLTLPGFVHDVCSAVHPMAVASPFFRQLPLEKFGLKWIYPPSPLAQTQEGKKAALMHLSVEETAAGLDRDEKAYRALYQPWVERSGDLFKEILQPLIHWPKDPFFMMRFGLKALRPAQSLILQQFKTEAARSLLGGIACHSSIPLSWAGSSAVALALGVAGHSYNWPIPQGGSGRVAQALVSYFKSLGGEVETGARVSRVEDLPEARWVFLDLTPRQIAQVAGSSLPRFYLRKLEAYRYGPGVFKMDFALSGPIPWIDPECSKAATVHVAGGFSEMIESEIAPFENRISKRPTLILAQPSLFDDSRAPQGKHVAWAYFHLPNGFSPNDPDELTRLLEDQIERFAPGFKRLILGKSAKGPSQMQALNENLVGGDISGGMVSLDQVLFRPFFYSGLDPYATPNPKIRICSSSTPPGPGVHGMSGYWAAKKILDHSNSG